MLSENDSYKTFALMYLMDDSDLRDDCLSLLDSKSSQLVREHLMPYQELGRKEQKKLALSELHRAFQDKSDKVFTEIDPSWYVNALKEETPKVTRLILGNLDRERQKQVVRTLPKNLAKQIKEQKPLNKLEPEVLEILRDKFANHFPKFPAFNREEALSFENLHALNKVQLIELFRDLGLHELSIALKEVNKSALRAILHRMAITDAKLLQTTIKQIGDLTEQRKMSAQLSVLAIDLDKVSAHNFFLEIGFCVFSRAIGPEHKAMVNALQYKLSPKEGYILKRYLNLQEQKGEVRNRKFIEDLVLERLTAVLDKS